MVTDISNESCIMFFKSQEVLKTESSETTIREFQIVHNIYVLNVNCVFYKIIRLWKHFAI
jgi:hypothetical protein